MSHTGRYIVYFGDTSSVVKAESPSDAVTMVSLDYEREWGEGAFDQYEVSVEPEEVDDY